MFFFVFFLKNTTIYTIDSQVSLGHQLTVCQPHQMDELNKTNEPKLTECIRQDLFPKLFLASVVQKYKK